MESYLALVRQRLEDRHRHLEGNIDRFGDWQLRFTVRIFGDCLDEAAHRELLGSYSEYRTEEELREFVRAFLPAYSAFALAELEEKKKDGERFDPPWLTEEEYQEMAVREKWPRIAAHLSDVTPLRLRREIARAGMLFRPYMLSDPGFNEGVLEFALYFDLLERLTAVSPDDLRAAAAAIAPLVDRAVAAGAGEACEKILREIRGTAARAAAIPADPERLLGPEMERFPREAPPEWRQRHLRKTLEGMGLKELRLSALSHIDLLTTEETREIVAPFMARFPSFYEIPTKPLRELILAIADRTPNRSITHFWLRYREGLMAVRPPVASLVWKLMPEEEKVAVLREDNALMDDALMARHLARFLDAADPGALGDPDRQLALLTDRAFAARHGAILKGAGADPGGGGIKTLYDAVTLLALRMAWTEPADGARLLAEIHGRIARAAGIQDNPTTQGR